MSISDRIVILGHSGFIGSNLLAHLSSSGKWDAVGASYPEFDLSLSSCSETLLPLLTENTTIVLAAAVKRQFADSLETYQQNMAIIENVCKLLVAKPVKRLVFMSSAAVYGEETENRDIHEGTAVNPTSFYGINKFTGECLLRKICSDVRKTSLVCLRPPLIYGPGDQGRTYGPAGFSAAALEGQPITLWGDGSELREFIFIQDFCRIFELLLENSFEGVLNVASGVPYCFTDVVSVLKEYYPQLDVRMRERTKNKVDNAFRADKIKALLPEDFLFTSLREGIALTLAEK